MRLFQSLVLTSVCDPTISVESLLSWFGGGACQPPMFGDDAARVQRAPSPRLRLIARNAESANIHASVEVWSEVKFD